MIVARAGDADAQKILILIHRFDDGRQEQQKLRVFHGCGAGIQQVFPLIGGDRPVVVLSGAVHPFKGLLMQQADKAVAVSHLFHDLHGQLIVIRGDVGGGIDRRHLMLAGRNLVVLRLGVDAQLPQFLVQVGHIGLHPWADGAEVVIFQLLSLGRPRAKERAAGQNEIRPASVILLVDEEVLLLRSHGGGHARNLFAKELQDPACLAAYGLHRAQQRRLLIQNLARVGAKRRGDAQRIILDKRIAGRIPRGVAARLKRGAQPSGRKGGGIRLALDQLLAGKLHDHRAIRTRGDKRIVLFRRDSRHRLKPVRKMRGPFFNGPILHRVGDHTGDLLVKGRALADCQPQRLINIPGQPFLHDGLVKHHAAKQLGDMLHSNPLPSCAAQAAFVGIGKPRRARAGAPPCDRRKYSPFSVVRQGIFCNFYMSIIHFLQINSLFRKIQKIIKY